MSNRRILKEQFEAGLAGAVKEFQTAEGEEKLKELTTLRRFILNTPLFVGVQMIYEREYLKCLHEADKLGLIEDESAWEPYNLRKRIRTLANSLERLCSIIEKLGSDEPSDYIREELYTAREKQQERQRRKEHFLQIAKIVAYGDTLMAEIDEFLAFVSGSVFYEKGQGKARIILRARLSYAQMILQVIREKLASPEAIELLGESQQNVEK